MIIIIIIIIIMLTDQHNNIIIPFKEHWEILLLLFMYNIICPLTLFGNIAIKMRGLLTLVV